MQITKLGLPRCTVGEGPVWDVAEQALYYIDIFEQKVFRWDPAGDEFKSWDVPDMIGSMMTSATSEHSPGGRWCGPHWCPLRAMTRIRAATSGFDNW